MAERSAPRLSAEIFADLRALAQSVGALHEISSIIYRDWAVTVDMLDGHVKDDPEHRWSTSKLNKNELMLLLGLTVQVADGKFAVHADQLLREFHDRVLLDGTPAFDSKSQKFVHRPESIGLLAREAIYFGADSFYLHQFSAFSRLRYRDDATWLLQKAGLSIRPMIDIARFIVDRINRQMTAVGQMRKERHHLTHGETVS